MSLKLPERRRFIRIEVPLRIKIKGDGWVDEATTKNISPIGMRFETMREFKESAVFGMDMSLPVPESASISIRGRVIWQSKTSREDNAPYDVGVEIDEIEESSRNVLLK